MNLLGRHPIEDEATANLLRGALTREAERVRPSADGLARILAAAALEAPDADPITGVTRPLPTRARPEPSPAASGPDDVPFPGTPLLSTDLSAELAAPSGPGAEPGVVTLDSRRRGAPRWLPTLAAAAAMVLLAGGLGIFQWGLGKEGNLAEIAGNAAGQNGQSRPAPAAEPLPVYLLERQNGRWALVREFTPTTLTVPADRLEVALELAVKGSGTDPDHLSAWSARGLVGEMTAKITDDSITITVSQELLGGSDPAGAELPPAALAVQQLVWTATAAAGSSLPVWIEGPDAASQLLGSIPLGRDFTRASGPQDPRAPVWISSLRDGEAMSTGTITVRGDALATVSGAVRWSLNDPAGTTVQSGTAPLAREDGAPAQVGERGLWQVPVPLTTPGRFQVRVSQPWPDQPATAPGWTDTKTVVVT